MKKNIVTLIILATVVPFLTTGCLTVDRNFVEIRNDILSSVDGEFVTDVQFGVGSVMLGIGSTFVKASDDDDFAAAILDDIDDVMIGVYKRKDNSTNVGDFSLLKKIDKKMMSNGFVYLVKSRTDNKLCAVYVSKTASEHLNKIFVVSLDEQELVIVKVRGNLDRVIAEAVKEKGMNINL